MCENLELVDGVNREGDEVDFERSDDTEEEDDEDELESYEGSNDMTDFIEAEKKIYE